MHIIPTLVVEFASHSIDVHKIKLLEEKRPLTKSSAQAIIYVRI